ncbi:MAG: D-2-hydroxyacid dehydrogenase [Chloroflexota bacterium]
MKLLTERPFSDELIAELRQADPQLELVYVNPREVERLHAEAADADVIYGSYGGGSGERFRRLLTGALQARWIHTTSAGVDEILCPEFFQREITMTCAKGEAVASLLAEHAMALLLAISRAIVPAARSASWQREAHTRGPIEIRGQTMGIVGFGGVGRELAQRALAFGMRVIGIKAHPTPPPPGVEAVWGPERLPELLAQSDVVVLILPNTPATEGSFGEAQLRQMKPSAILINVGRGQVMDGTAVERALVEGWIAGAGLDVMPIEPWPGESPLWKMNNVLLTPHIAGNGTQRGARDVQAFVANYARFVRGEPLHSVVDRQARY